MRKVKSRSDLTRLQIDMSESAPAAQDQPERPAPQPQQLAATDMTPIANALREIGEQNAAAIRHIQEQTKQIISSIADKIAEQPRRQPENINIDSDVIRDNSGRIKSIKSIVRKL